MKSSSQNAIDTLPRIRTHDQNRIRHKPHNRPEVRLGLAFLLLVAEIERQLVSLGLKTFIAVDVRLRRGRLGYSPRQETKLILRWGRKTVTG